MVDTRILLALEDTLARPLIHKFNNSVKTGFMPTDFKSGNVTGIYTKGSKQEPGNYRLISLTFVVCKTMERLVKGRLPTHLEMNNLRPKSQTVNMASESGGMTCLHKS